MTIQTVPPIDADLAAWNDRMYERHPTPYGAGLAGIIEQARVRAVLRLARVGPSEAVLEVGCESGRLLASLPPAGRVVGADISRRALEDAAARFTRAGRAAELVQLDAQEGLPFAQGEFEVVICSEMLEHVAHPERVVEHIQRIATAATRVVVSVPIERPKVRVKAVLRRLGLLERLFPGIEPAQSEWHVHAFSTAMLESLVAPRFVTLTTAAVWFAHRVVLLRKRS